MGKIDQLNLLKSEKAICLFQNPRFLTQWRQLRYQTPGFTSLQSPEFVIPWYDFKEKLFSPVLSVAYNETGDLVGLLCLAQNKKEGWITHAGFKDAEYSGWLSLPDLSVSFLEKTLKLIKDQFQIKLWKWQALPHGLEFSVLKDLKVPGLIVSIEPCPCQIWNLDNNVHFDKLRSSKSRRKNSRRLSRNEELVLEIVSDRERLIETIPTIADQCDFRTLACFNFRLFGENPGLSKFWVNLFDLGLSHNAILSRAGRIIGYSGFLIDGKQAFPAIISYEPSESGHSPGSILMMYHAEKLREEGYKIIDMTPGKEAYKSDFSDSSVTLMKPTFYFVNSERYKDQLLEIIKSRTKSLLQVFSLNPKTLKGKMDNFLLKSQKINSKYQRENFRSFLGDWTHQKHRLSSYSVIPANLRDRRPIGAKVNIQGYKDLWLYDDYRPFVTARELSQLAWNKFNRLEKLITIVKNDKLLWFGWLGHSGKFISQKGFKSSFSFGKEGLVLYDIYHHSSMNQSIFICCLETTIKTIAENSRQNFYFLLPGHMDLPQEIQDKWKASKLETSSYVRIMGHTFGEKIEDSSEISSV